MSFKLVQKALQDSEDALLKMVPPGTVLPFAGATPPEGYLICDGSAISRTDYGDFFSAIDEAWGVGDGSTTFNIPDLRGRSPIGSGQGSGLTNRTLASNHGVETINIQHLHSAPSHNHRWYDDGGAASTSQTSNSSGNGLNISGGTKSAEAAGIALCAAAAANTRLETDSYTTNAAGNTGNGLSASQTIIQPCSVVNFIIRY